MNSNATTLLLIAALGALILAALFWQGNRGTSAAVDEILDLWKAAIGGERLEEVQSIYLRSAIQTGGLNGTVEEWYTIQGQHRQQLDLAGVYKVLTVFDGLSGQGWMLDHNDKVQPLQGVELQAETTVAYLGSFSHLFPQRLQGQVAYVGQAQGFYIVKFSPQGGKPVTVYLDPSTYLPVKEEVPDAERVQTSTLSDWRSVDGVMLPFHLRQTTGDPDYDLVVEVLEARLNPTLEPTAFGRPEEPAPDFRFTNGNQSLDIPFELNSNHIYLQAQLNGSQPLWFLLDTGAEATVIDSAQAKANGIQLQGQLEGRGAGEGSVDVALASGVSFSLPGVEVNDQTVAAIDMGPLAAFEGRGMDGILGFDFISRFVVEIDYEQRLLHLYDPQGYEPSGGQAIPFTFDGNDPIIKAKLQVAGQEIEGQFLVDTGARTALVLSKPFVEAHGLLDSVSPLLSGTLGFGVGGETKQLIGRVEELSLGDVALEQVITGFSQDEGGTLASPDRAGLIGGEVLRRFTVTFDYVRQHMILSPNGHLNQPFEYDMSGLTLMTEGQNFDVVNVYKVLEGSPASAAGIQAGDILVSLDGQSAAQLGLEAIRTLFKEEGRQITLALQRGQEQLQVTLALRRLI